MTEFDQPPGVVHHFMEGEERATLRVTAPPGATFETHLDGVGPVPFTVHVYPEPTDVRPEWVDQILADATRTGYVIERMLD